MVRNLIPVKSLDAKLFYVILDKAGVGSVSFSFEIVFLFYFLVIYHITFLTP